MKLSGVVAVVTGGASGIGRAICDALLNKEAKVCVADINADLGQKTAKEFQAKYGEKSAIFVNCDVCSLQSVEDTFDKVIKEFGRIDVVANNAGILDEAKYEKTVDINVTGVMRVLQVALRHMDVSQGGNGGVIINTASMAGLVVGEQFPAYFASKHAVVAYTRCFALPYHYERHGVRINCLCPVFVETPLIQSSPGKWFLTQEDFDSNYRAEVLRPEAVAEAFIQLAEDDTQNGAALTVQAGQPPSNHVFSDHVSSSTFT